MKPDLPGRHFFWICLKKRLKSDFPQPEHSWPPTRLRLQQSVFCWDCPVDEIKAGLENFKPVKGRMNVIETARQIHLVDDTYNANPVSMAAAIQTLQKIKDGHRGILVVGDMLELGEGIFRAAQKSRRNRRNRRHGGPVCNGQICRCRCPGCRRQGNGLRANFCRRSASHLRAPQGQSQKRRLGSGQGIQGNGYGNNRSRYHKVGRMP